MKKYKDVELGGTVEAVRYEKKNRDDVVSVLADAYHSFTLTFKEEFIIYNQGGERRINVGEWLVKLDETFLVFQDQHFQEVYEEITAS